MFHVTGEKSFSSPSGDKQYLIDATQKTITVCSEKTEGVEPKFQYQTFKLKDGQKFPTDITTKNINDRLALFEQEEIGLIKWHRAGKASKKSKKMVTEEHRKTELSHKVLGAHYCQKAEVVIADGNSFLKVPYNTGPNGEKCVGLETKNEQGSLLQKLKEAPESLSYGTLAGFGIEIPAETTSTDPVEIGKESLLKFLAFNMMVGNYDAFGKDGGNCMVFLNKDTKELEFSMIDPGHVGQTTKVKNGRTPLTIDLEGNLQVDEGKKMSMLDPSSKANKTGFMVKRGLLKYIDAVNYKNFNAMLKLGLRDSNREDVNIIFTDIGEKVKQEFGSIEKKEAFTEKFGGAYRYTVTGDHFNKVVDNTLSVVAKYQERA